jgi:lipopolysaccharide transport system permease protein
MRVLSELYAYRQMLVSLVRKDLRGRYKGSVLGFLWTFVNPLLQLLVYTVVFSTILRADIEKFYLFLFVALVPWIFFSASLNGGASSILAHKDMVKKIYFPREVLPIAYVTSCFVNMLFSFVIIFVVLIFSGSAINPAALLCLPAVMLVEYILALGIALLSSAVTVFFRDLEHILGIVSMAWMYLTPIVYDISMVPQHLVSVFMANPMTPIIMAYRDILYYARVPSYETLLHALVLGVAVLIAGFWVFGKLKKRFVEEI